MSTAQAQSQPQLQQAQNESLDTLTAMVNQTLIETGRFFRASGSTMRSRTQLKRTIPLAHEQFQRALDDLSEQIYVAKAFLERDYEAVLQRKSVLRLKNGLDDSATASSTYIKDEDQGEEGLMASNGQQRHSLADDTVTNSPQASAATTLKQEQELEPSAGEVQMSKQKQISSSSSSPLTSNGQKAEDILTEEPPASVYISTSAPPLPPTTTTTTIATTTATTEDTNIDVAVDTHSNPHPTVETMNLDSLFPNPTKDNGNGNGNDNDNKDNLDMAMSFEVHDIINDGDDDDESANQAFLGLGSGDNNNNNSNNSNNNNNNNNTNPFDIPSTSNPNPNPNPNPAEAKTTMNTLNSLLPGLESYASAVSVDEFGFEGLGNIGNTTGNNGGGGDGNQNHAQDIDNSMYMNMNMQHAGSGGMDINMDDLPPPTHAEGSSFEDLFVGVGGVGGAGGGGDGDGQGAGEDLLGDVEIGDLDDSWLK